MHAGCKQRFPSFGLCIVSFLIPIAPIHQLPPWSNRLLKSSSLICFSIAPPLNGGPQEACTDDWLDKSYVVIVRNQRAYNMITRRKQLIEYSNII